LGFSTLIGLLVGVGALALSVILEGGELGRYLSPSAALIVFGGTLGATLTSFPLSQVMKLPKLMLKGIAGGEASMSPSEMVELFVGLADKARRQGLLSLEDEATKIQDKFVSKGLLLVVDGVDPEVVRTILDMDLAALAERHQRGYSMVESMGGYAPTMGIIGTVMGLVTVLSSLDNPADLGPAIAVAFIATLYGVGSANLLWLPFGSKLKAQSREEIWLREVAREGILAVQAGDNTRVVREKLEAFLAASEREVKGAKIPDSSEPAEAGKKTVAMASGG